MFRGNENLINQRSLVKLVECDRFFHHEISMFHRDFRILRQWPFVPPHIAIIFVRQPRAVSVEDEVEAWHRWTL